MRAVCKRQGTRDRRGSEERRLTLAKLGVAALGAMAAALLTAAPALATSYTPGGNFSGGPGSADGELELPERADVYEANGHLVVADSANDRVQVFAPDADSGSYLAKFTHPDLDSPLGIAIDQTDGSIYVSDSDDVLKFDSSYDPVASFTSPGVTGALAVDPRNGDLLVADDVANDVKRFKSDGTPSGTPFDGTNGSTAFASLVDIAVNSIGDVYVVDTTGDIAQGLGESSARRFTPEGLYVSTVNTPPLVGEPDRVARIDVDPDTDEVALSTRQDAMQNDLTPGVAIYGEDGSLINSDISNNFHVYLTLTKIADLAYDSGRGRLYVTHDRNYWVVDGEHYGSAPGVQTIIVRREPRATIDPPTGATYTTVELAGAVDPNGTSTDWRFQYRKAGATGWASSTPLQDAGAGLDPVDVEAEVEDLSAGVSYEARLVATSVLGEGASDPVTFETTTGPPLVQVKPPVLTGSGESALLAAVIVPGGADVGYRFEYGTSDCAASASACAPVPGGAGTVATASGEREVTAQLDGLEVGETYFYRVVAESSLGDTTSATRSFTAAAQRAFELVSPADSLAPIETTGAFTSADGELVVYSSAESLAGAEPNGPWPTMDSYTSRRGATGWTTEWSTDASDEPGSFGSRTRWSNDDGSRQVVQTENAMDPTDTFTHSQDGYLRVRGQNGRGIFTWLTPGPRPDVANRHALAATPDVKSVLVQNEVAMVPADTDEGYDLYVVTDGVPRLVSSGPGDAGAEVSGRVAVAGTLGADGSYVYFPTDQRLSAEDVDFVNDIYRWNADGTYELISVNRRTDPPSGDAPSLLLAASTDGDVACFTTATALVNGDDDGDDDVYCYTRSTDTLDWASSGLQPAVPSPARALALSGDGSSLFFSSGLALTGDDGDGGLSLYVRRGATTEYVSPLAPSDLVTLRRAASPEPAHRAIDVTADGRTMVFTTAAQALGSDTDAVTDVYRWTLGEGLEQVSLGNGPGASTTGAAPSKVDQVLSDDAVTGRVMTTDGESVFFESADALVPQDKDGGFVDVYEWRAGGEVRLVSPAGAARDDALYADNSADGSTVFVVTSEPIVPHDVNAVRDIYAARVGGGFPSPTQRPECEGESCQGAPGGPTATPRPATDRFAGSGDTRGRSEQARQRLLKLSAAQRRALARRGRTQVRVRVGAAGMVAISASARLGGRTVRLPRAWRKATKAGVVRLPLTLTPRARAHLRRTGKLRIAIVATYSKADEAVSQVVVLRG